MKTKLAFCISAALAGSVVVSDAHSQTTAPDTSAVTRRTVEEVVVTARRREERLQDVPISTTAFTVSELENRSITKMEDLMQATPNLSFDSIGRKNEARVYIRGVGQDNPLIRNDPGVGIYVDGVYLARIQGSMFDTLDLERIEVLRGPQGTLFGKNTIGGAINVVTVKPGPDLGGYVKVGAGNFDYRAIKAAANIPLIEDQLFVRASVNINDRDGYMHNVFDGADLMSDRVRAGRVSLRYLATPDLEFTLTADASQQHENGTMNNCQWDPAPSALAPGGTLATLMGLDALLGTTIFQDFRAACMQAEQLGPDQGASDVAPDSNFDVYGATGTVDWRTGPTDIKSITAWRKVESVNNINIDGSSYALLDQIGFPGFQEQLSQEFQFSGVSFGDRLRWITGVHLFKEDIESRAGGCFLPAVPLLGCDRSKYNSTQISNESVGVFGEATWSLTERLDFTAGIRNTRESKDTQTATYSSSTGKVSSAVVDDSWDVWTPRFSASFDVSDQVMVYGSWSRGFKSGGLIGASGRTFEPEYVEAWEAGLKSEWFGKRLRINSALFYSDYDDMQLTVLRADPVSGLFTNEITNAGKSTVKGAELEVVAVPTAGLSLSFGLGYTDAGYDEFNDINPQTREVIDRSNLEFPHVPKLNYNAAISYGVPVGSVGTLTARADWWHSSATYEDVSNVEAIKKEALGLLNGRLSLKLRDGKTEVALWAKNILNEDYIAMGATLRESIGVNFLVYGPPRFYGIEITRQFGQ